MHQPPPARPSGSPPSYDSTLDTKLIAGPEDRQTQETESKTKTGPILVDEEYLRRRIRTRLPDAMLSPTPPPVLSFPDELAYPNTLIRKENVIYPAQNTSFPLYYVSEPTFISNRPLMIPDTRVYKRHGTIDGRLPEYTTIGLEPVCYTAFQDFTLIYTQGYKQDWWFNETKSSTSTLGVTLKVNPQCGRGFTLSIHNVHSGTSVMLERNVLPAEISEKGWFKTHSWSDSTTKKVFAWELQTTPDAISSASAAGLSSTDGNRLEFAKEAVSKTLRDILTVAWCMNLWIDAEAARRKIHELKKESKGALRRLTKLWQNEGGSAGSSRPETNPLRQMLGLDEVVPQRELMWYERDYPKPARKSRLGAALRSFRP